MQVNTKAGLTFASGLRSMMRADPDILMVGEIRDRETAQIAIEGALTGHMVLSTLHTNDAPTAITRLIEMGIEPFLVASAIDCVVAQRLARDAVPALQAPDDHPGRGAARPRLRGAVRHRGLRARRLRALRRDGLPRPDRAVRGDAMSERSASSRCSARSADQIAAVAVREGMRRLRDDGLDKVKAGLTSMAEVARVTGSG